MGAPPRALRGAPRARERRTSERRELSASSPRDGRSRSRTSAAAFGYARRPTSSRPTATARSSASRTLRARRARGTSSWRPLRRASRPRQVNDGRERVAPREARRVLRARARHARRRRHGLPRARRGGRDRRSRRARARHDPSREPTCATICAGSSSCAIERAGEGAEARALRASGRASRKRCSASDAQAIAIYRARARARARTMAPLFARWHACSARRAMPRAPPRCSSMTAISARARARRSARSSSRAVHRASSSAQRTRSPRRSARSNSSRNDADADRGRRGAPLRRRDARAAAVVLEREPTPQTGKFEAQADVLEVLIATAAAKEDRIELYARLADVQEQARRLRRRLRRHRARGSEFPTELDLWDRLGVLANKTQQVAAVRRRDRRRPSAHRARPGFPPHVEIDLAERAATLYDEMLGEIERADAVPRAHLSRATGQRTRLHASEADPHDARALGRARGALRAMRSSATPDVARRTRAPRRGRAHRRGDHRRQAEGDRLLRADPRARAGTSRRLGARQLYAHEQRWDEPRVARSCGASDRRARTRASTEAPPRHASTSATGRAEGSARHTSRRCSSAETGNREARELVERCLDVPELRSRAAGRPRRCVQRTRGDPRPCAGARDSPRVRERSTIEKRELLRRIAELRDERLTDDQGAFDAYARLVAARAERRRGAQRLSRSRDASAHTSARRRCSSRPRRAADVPQPRAEILSDVAKIYEDLLHDAIRAERVYRRSSRSTRRTRRSRFRRRARSSGSTRPAGKQRRARSSMLRVR